MSLLLQYGRKVVKMMICGLFIGLASFGFSFAQPALADNAQASGQYIAADGTDLTAIVQCLPEQLSQPDLERALKESGNDFLEKVFNLKGNYSDYELEKAEVDYLNCLESKGVTSQVAQ